MNHSRIRQNVWVLVAGLLSISNLVTAQDATPVDDLDIVVYQSDFSAPVGSEWSSDSISVTPRDSRSFLGEFSDQTITLDLSNLPQHESVSVVFDLFIMRTWDGNYLGHGPDVWQLKERDGATLLQTTFLNQEVYNQFGQSFPDGFNPDSPSIFDSFTGASEVQTLGYGIDAVYRVERTFSHTGASLVLEFTGIGLQGPGDESWGLDNVSVSVSEKAVAVAIPKTLEDGLVSHHRFDGDVLDSVSAAFHGEATSITYVEDRNGVAGAAAFFDGVESLVEVPNTETFNPLPVTISLWIKAKTNPAAHLGLVSKYFASSVNGFAVFAKGESVNTWYFGAEGNVFKANDGIITGSVLDNSWHHVVAAFDNDGGKLYVDSVERGKLGWAGSPSASTSAQNLIFGA
ncbi:LamG domain-containing protein, partial [bacterium]|nr:LamG domain-containing protein [bacterium]